MKWLISLSSQMIFIRIVPSISLRKFEKCHAFNNVRSHATTNNFHLFHVCKFIIVNFVPLHNIYEYIKIGFYKKRIWSAQLWYYCLKLFRSNRFETIFDCTEIQASSLHSLLFFAFVTKMFELKKKLDSFHSDSYQSCENIRFRGSSFGTIYHFRSQLWHLIAFYWRIMWVCAFTQFLQTNCAYLSKDDKTFPKKLLITPYQLYNSICLQKWMILHSNKLHHSLLNPLLEALNLVFAASQADYTEFGNEILKYDWWIKTLPTRNNIPFILVHTF